MATVTLRYRGPLAEAIGKEEESLSVGTVRDALKHIKSAYGAKAEKLAKTMLIVIDGESILLRKGFATPLREGEILQFLPICGGG